jgi:hypothetical protein
VVVAVTAVTVAVQVIRARVPVVMGITRVRLMAVSSARLVVMPLWLVHGVSL